MKYVACYCRVSHEEQVKFGFSIEAQKDALEKYCKEHQYKYEFYIDEGVSASSMRRRTALQEMLSKSNVFDMILFTKLDRLSRNVLDANNINKLLIDNNCVMKAIDEDDIDTSNADGTFMFNLRVSLAQREIGKTSERIKFIFKNKRTKGEVTSGTCKYGYKIENKKFVINNEEAANIIDLYKYFISVNGDFSKTYKDFFIKRFPNKGRDSLYKYLRDVAYIGKYKLYRKNTYLDDYIPAIVEENLFNQVQRLLKVRQRTGNYINSKTALFAGLVFCIDCDNRMTKKADNRVKSNLIRYCCDRSSRFIPGTTTKQCINNKTIREDTIEEYLLNNLKIEANKYIIDCKTSERKNKLVDNSKKIKNIENKLEKLKDLYIDDLIDKDTYKCDYTKYMGELEKLKIQNTENKPKDFTQLNKLLNTDIINIYNKLTREEQRRFWLLIINKIYVKNGKVEKILFV